MENKPFTPEQLATFDGLTKLMSSRKQMDRIEGRLIYFKWVKQEGITKSQEDAMHQELILQGKW